MRGRIAEDVDLPVLRGHVADGVEHQIDHRELTGHPRRRHIADRDLDRVATRLARDPRRHRPAQLDATHRHTASGQRRGDPPGPNGELEYRAVGQFFEDVHRGRHHLGQVRTARGVVARGHALGEPAVRRVVSRVRRTDHGRRRYARDRAPLTPFSTPVRPRRPVAHPRQITEPRRPPTRS